MTIKLSISDFRLSQTFLRCPTEFRRNESVCTVIVNLKPFNRFPGY